MKNIKIHSEDTKVYLMCEDSEGHSILGRSIPKNTPEAFMEYLAEAGVQLEEKVLVNGKKEILAKNLYSEVAAYLKAKANTDPNKLSDCCENYVMDCNAKRLQDGNFSEIHTCPSCKRKLKIDFVGHPVMGGEVLISAIAANYVK